MDEEVADVAQDEEIGSDGSEEAFEGITSAREGTEPDFTGFADPGGLFGGETVSLGEEGGVRFALEHIEPGVGKGDGFGEATLRPQGADLGDKVDVWEGGETEAGEVRRAVGGEQGDQHAGDQKTGEGPAAADEAGEEVHGSSSNRTETSVEGPATLRTSSATRSRVCSRMRSC